MTLYEKLAPYLPYDLKIVPLLNPHIELIMHPIGGSGKIGIMEVVESPKLYKPVLRPMSIFDEDVPELNIHLKDGKLYSWVMDGYDKKPTLVELSESHQTREIFIFHIDIFGMIESGEAIDINKIKEHE